MVLGRRVYHHGPREACIPQGVRLPYHRVYVSPTTGCTSPYHGCTSPYHGCTSPYHGYPSLLTNLRRNLCADRPPPLGPELKDRLNLEVSSVRLLSLFPFHCWSLLFSLLCAGFNRPFLTVLSSFDSFCQECQNLGFSPFRPSFTPPDDKLKPRPRQA